MQPEMEPRLACRVCGAARLEEAGVVDGYRFLACPRCAFVFTPQVRLDTLAAAYEQGYHGIGMGAPVEGWATDAAFLDPALARLPGPLRILDFGTGQSHVPDVLRRDGHRVVAVDVAPPLRPHPDRLTGRIETLDLPEASFDLVYSYQVFEHLPEPRPVLARLLDLTRPGGLVLVHTDMEMPERDRQGFTGWWYVLPPDHCAFYRHRTFEALLSGTPHRIVLRDEKRVLIARGA